MSKYIGIIFEGRWKVTGVKRDGNHTIYTLTNIFNQKTLDIRDHTMTKIFRGDITVSKVIIWKLKRTRNNRGWNN